MQQTGKRNNDNVLERNTGKYNHDDLGPSDCDKTYTYRDSPFFEQDHHLPNAVAIFNSIEHFHNDRLQLEFLPNSRVFQYLLDECPSAHCWPEQRINGAVAN